jgi:formylglycine-generating enzyme required for sulfatase activity
MHTKETWHMKRPHFIFPFLAACVCFVVLAMSCLTTPVAAQATDEPAKGNAVAVINDGLNSNEGGTMISLTKEVTDHALSNAAIASHGAAWQTNKMGGSSATVGGLLGGRDSLKSASNALGIGSTLIDHAGYTSTAAGEIAGGYYAQGFITIADGLGKSVVSGIASVTGASFGTLAGPAGTIAGGAVGGYAGSQAWDQSVGKLTSAIKTGLGRQDDKRQFREMSGPKMLGMTSEEIHEAWLKYKKELADKKNQEQLGIRKNNGPVAKSPAANLPVAKLDALPKKAQTTEVKPAVIKGTTANVGPVAGMVLIPAGSFQMGDAFGEPWSSEIDAVPVHTVTLSAFYLDKYEVTKALWDEVYTWAIAHGYTFKNAGAGTAPNHPVTNVIFYDILKWLNARSEKEGRQAVYYADVDFGKIAIYRTTGAAVSVKWTANGYRLPTEAEWEYAARGGTTTRFYTGSCISSDQANYDGDRPGNDMDSPEWKAGLASPRQCPTGPNRRKTTAVGSFAANPWGLFDMAGNVAEWTWDATSNYSSRAVTNPRGPDSGEYRIIRGGRWASAGYYLKSSSRDEYMQYYGTNYLGFRSALSQP